MWLAATVALLLNRKRVDLGELFAFAGVSIFPLLAVHELPAVALVSAVFAGWNIQQWYQHTFRQSYRVDTSEILFARGGRALTVLAMTGIAYLAISGRLESRRNIHTGIGFSPQLVNHIEGLKADLYPAYDDRPFNFTIPQGDILIWNGHKSFVDSRTQLFSAANNEEDLLDLQNRVRHALHSKRKRDPFSGQPKVWMSTFDRFEVTHIIPRLFGRPPDYATYFDLLDSNRWHLQNLGSATAVFYRKDCIPEDAALQKYLNLQSVNFVTDTFRSQQPEQPAAIRTGWAHQPTWQETYLTLPHNNNSLTLHAAQHAVSHLRYAEISQMDISPAVYVAMAYSAIRSANATLVDDPNSEAAYLLLGLAYDYLSKLEKLVAPTSGTALWRNRRYYQAVAAINQALIINPDNINAHLQLIELYKRFGQVDLTLRSLDACEKLTSNRELLSADGKTLKRELMQLRDKLRVHANKVDQLIEEQRAKKTNLLNIAGLVARAGCSLRALELIDELPVQETSQSIPYHIFRVHLLLYAGQAEAAQAIIQQLKSATPQEGFRNWLEVGALAELDHANYDQSANYWLQIAQQQERDQLLGMFQTLPLLPAPKEIPWPVNQTTMAFHSLYESPVEIARFKFQAVLCYLEAGRNRDAEQLLREILLESPNTTLRPLLRFYLLQLSDELIDFEPPSDWIPIDKDMFIPELSTN